ncbi:MAG: SDR family oxidoreductase [Acidimicrobiales bacterium]
MTGTKTVVITGATAGVGRETARIFAKHGFDVALLARGEAGLRATAHDVESYGQRCLAISTDVADYHQVEHAAERIEAELGPIDVWVNNAMTTVFSSLKDVRSEDFERAVNVTFLGQVWGTMAALRRMRPRDAGAIVNVGSALSFVGIPLQSAYCASKFACRGFFEATRAEILHDGLNVRLSMVHLPAMNTPQFDWCETTMEFHPQPVPPIYQPEIAAQAIFTTALDGKRSRIVGSWNKMLVVMDSFFPGLGNHFASRGAWESQLTKQPVKPDRPSNLRAPADEGVDYGGHGIFDNRSRGVRDPSFLVTLPKIGFTYVTALGATLRESADVRRRHKASLTRLGVAKSDDGNDDSPESGQRSNDAEPRRLPESGEYTSTTHNFETDSLDVLTNEDHFLLKLFDGLALSRGSTVEERYAYGNLAKESLRHIAVRQACIVDVTRVLADIPEMSDIRDRMLRGATERRPLYDEIATMARGVQTVSLDVGQDFDGALSSLIDWVSSEIQWELSGTLASIRSALSRHHLSGKLRSARYVRRHAPTHLSTKGPRWYEQAPIVSSLVTMYGHLNDLPRASREWRSS